MGGSKSVGWAEALDASFEAGLARDEEIAAADLAFSLKQDVDVRAAVVRSHTGWAVAGPDAVMIPVDEVGLDYVRAGAVVVPISRAVMRSTAGEPPHTTEMPLLHLLGRACRAGAAVTLQSAGGVTPGSLVRVAKDHVAVRHGDVETIVGLTALESVRLPGYSASRGFSG